MGFFMDLLPDLLFQWGVTEPVVSCWGIILLLVLLSVYLKRNLSPIPNRFQSLFEVFFTSLRGALHLMMGEEGERHFSFTATIALLVTTSNLVALIPGVVSPSEDINGPLAWALLVFLYMHLFSMRRKGIFLYVKEYFQPVWFLFPINILSELAKPISLSFRLFGNMFGGGLLVAVVSMFLPYLVPVPLAAWFSFFIGLLHAFIFTMLTISYIAAFSTSQAEL